MAQPRPAVRHWRRLRSRAVPLLRVGVALFLALAIVLVVPPFRRALAVVSSKAILVVASPLAPHIADFHRLSETSKIVAGDGSVIAQLDNAQRREPVKLADLSPDVRHAVLAAEDAEFYHHSGIDPPAVLRAFFHTATGSTQGGSTITQQLAKINYTARERTVFRKLKEVLYATQLERKYSKDELLQRYVNQVYFGEGAYGLQAAAQTFFGVDAKNLTAAQAATLAGKIRSPEGLDPRKAPNKVIARRNQVLAGMRAHKWLDDSAYTRAKNESLNLAPPRPPGEQTKAPHFVEYVKREAQTIDALGPNPSNRLNQLITGGYTIETTFDPKTFDATVAAVQARLSSPGDPNAAAATVVPGDGAIRSLFGGLDFASTQYDVSSLGGRQPGSSFKPFTYLAALRTGIDPRSRFDGNSPRVIPCYGPKPVNNFDGEDMGGSITVDDALVHSVNVVFVDLGCKVGVKNVHQSAIDAGIPDKSVEQTNGNLFLGGGNTSVSCLDMASAYASFAAKGIYAKPYAIVRIKNDRGKVVYEHKAQTHPAFKPEEVGVLTNPLERVVTEGTGRAAAIDRPVAGKTGTSENNLDAWFNGYTPQLATSVWVGYEPKHPMTNVHGRVVVGGVFPAMIFSDTMKAASKGLPPLPLYTASPDQLNLHQANATPNPSSSTTSSSTTSSSTSSTSTLQQPATTSTAPAAATSTTTTTTAPPKRTTTTTSTTSTSTTTTIASQSATTTTSPP